MAIQHTNWQSTRNADPHILAALDTTAPEAKATGLEQQQH